MVEVMVVAGAKEHVDSVVTEPLGDERGVVVEASVMDGNPTQTPCDRAADADLPIVLASAPVADLDAPAAS